MKHHSFQTCLFTLMLFLAPLNVVTQVSTVRAALPQGTAYTNSPFTPGETDSLVDSEDLANNITYLPIVLNNYPLTPAAPILNAISNGDGDGNYTVSWSSSEGANTYTLEEDDNEGFTSPTTVYSGSNTSTAISGRDVGTYYYRVRASSASANSDWSNVVSVEVTVLLPACPHLGIWTGVTDQGTAFKYIDFVVENSPTCQISANSAADSLQIAIFDSCGYATITRINHSSLITNSHFDTGADSVRVTGNFTSLTTASGTFSMDRPDPYIPSRRCKASGTWTAKPYP